ncbi:MAG: sulfur oxidation c-type cytochrome SoxX [Maritimibacter sp.]|nr:sulfur oxidation c-type cytochrome SoxX [Maritimibacter sp.]
MRNLFVLCAAATMAIPSVLNADTAPGDVVFGELGEVAAPLTDVAGDPAAGLTAATTRSIGNCVACHVAEGWADTAFPGNVGPVLTGIANVYDEGQLRGILVNSKKAFPGTVMPAFYNLDDIIRPGLDYTGKAAESHDVTILTAQQIEDLVALLKTFDEPLPE